VERTGKLLLVDESGGVCTWSAEVAERVVEHHFWSLDAPLLRPPRSWCTERSARFLTTRSGSSCGSDGTSSSDRPRRCRALRDPPNVRLVGIFSGRSSVLPRWGPSTDRSARRWSCPIDRVQPKR
jgi:hypothetical protein